MHAVVFDLYDTLVTEPEKPEPFVRLLESLQLDPHEYAAVRRALLTKNYPDLYAFLQEHCPGHALDVALYEEAIRKDMEQVCCFQETMEVLQMLRARGMKLGLLSNASTEYKGTLERLGLATYFDVTIFSCDVGCKKPEPQIFAIMLQQLGVEPQDALMVGNSRPSDIQGAQAVGMHALLIDRTAGEASDSIIVSLKDLLQRIPPQD